MVVNAHGSEQGVVDEAPGPAGVGLEFWVGLAEVGDFVFEYEKKFDADLIMIMTKKEELTLSDNISVTARYIINNSEIPVMSIRPKEQEYITGPTTAF